MIDGTWDLEMFLRLFIQIRPILRWCENKSQRKVKNEIQLKVKIGKLLDGVG